MKDRNRYESCKFVATIIIGLVFLSPIEAAGSVSQLSLELLYLKADYARYEAVPLTAVLTNPTEETIFTKNRILLDHLALRITDTADGRTYFYSPQSLSNILKGPGRISPGESIHLDRILLWDITGAVDQPAFERPGVYSIVARLTTVGEDGTVVTIESAQKEVVIKVLSEQEEAAIAFFGGEDTFVALLRRGPRKYCKAIGGQACLTRILRFVNDFRESAYSAQLSLSFFSAITGGTIRGVARDEGIQIAEDFLEHWPEHGVAPRVTYLLITSLSESGAVSDCQARLQDFERRWPTRRRQARALRDNWSNCVATN